MTAARPRPAWATVWWLAIRPKTLFAALAPVAMGGALAWSQDVGHVVAFLAALGGALLIQIGTNFANDAFDFLQGADTEERVGPVRVVAAGWVTPKAMLGATALAFVLALACCGYLVLRAGWPMAVLGAVSVLSGLWYTAGRWSLAYLGLAEIFVLIFFGPVAVAGTHYVQALTLDWFAVVAGLAPGGIATALLAVNNLRDIDGDREAGKKTPAVRFGRRFARGEITVCLVGGIVLVPVALVVCWQRHWGVLLGLLALLPALGVLKTAWAYDDAAHLNPALARTAKALLLFGAAFSAGVLLW